MVYGLLIYISFLFLKTRKENKISNVIFSKLLFSFSVCYMMTSLYLTYVMVKNFMKLIEIALSNNSDLMTVLENKFENSTILRSALRNVKKPLIFMDHSLGVLIIYAILILVVCLISYLKIKENKNVKTLITLICFASSYTLFMFCPFNLTCTLTVFIPQSLGVFLTIAVLKQLTANKREEINIKGGKAHFVLSIITLVLVSLNLVSYILWFIFGQYILETFLKLRFNYV